jgi:sugar phosphate isomerase/epimerase
MFALSTAWGARRTKEPAKLIEEARRLGFDCMELHHSLTLTSVAGILEASERGEITVASLHNFCPAILWRSGPDAYSPSSLDRRERSMSVKKTKETIDMAARFGAKVVVMHLGRVEMKDYTSALIALYDAGQKGTPRYERIKGKLLAKREKKRKRHMDVLYRSLDELVSYSEPKGIKIGIENRYSAEDIPFLDEIKLILDEFQGSNIRYWHDVGHAQCAEELDIAGHESFLQMFSDRMVGIHLHDVIGVSDHRVPLTGEFDFKKLKPYLSKDTIKVVEAFVDAPDEQVVEGMEYIRRCLSHEEEQACRETER